MKTDRLGQPIDWPDRWALQSEHVRYEKRVYWIMGLTRDDKAAAEEAGIDLDEHTDKRVIQRRGSRLAKALREKGAA